jgi:thioredoxin-like negative regulator of GroEL
VHLDADVSPDAPWARGVSSYPTLIALDPGGAELARLRGVQPAAELVAWLRAACAAAAASRGD